MEINVTEHLRVLENGKHRVLKPSKNPHDLTDEVAGAVIKAKKGKKHQPPVEDDDQPADLEDMKVPELKEIAGKMEIEGSPNMKRDELIDAIKAKRAEQEDGE